VSEDGSESQRSGSGGTEDGERRSMVLFLLGDTEFGLPLEAVVEVARTPPITRVPSPPPNVCGILNLRGTLMTVLDGGSRLGGGPTMRRERVLILEAAPGEERIALLVDSVTDLWEVGLGEMEEPPAEARTGAGGDAVRGVVRRGRRVATLIEPGVVLAPLFHVETTGR